MKYDGEPKGMRMVSLKRNFRVRKLHEIFTKALKTGKTYTSLELLKELNSRCFEQYKITSKTSLLSDLKFMHSELDAPFPAYNSFNRDTKYYYTKPFTLEDQYGLTKYERKAIRTALVMLSQVDGLPKVNLNCLLPLRDIVKDEDEDRQIMSVERNPSKAYATLVSDIFEFILHKNVIRFDYRSYRHPDRLTEVIISPWQLKQYDERFYLVGWNHGFERTEHFAVDRIENISKINNKYKECREDLDERYRNVIGVTLPADGQVMNVLFWVDDLDAKYVKSRPLHLSQTVVPPDEEQVLRRQYHVPDRGLFFRLHCAGNYELKRELLSYLNGLIVLEPEELRDDLKQIIENLSRLYH